METQASIVKRAIRAHGTLSALAASANVKPQFVSQWLLEPGDDRWRRIPDGLCPGLERSTGIAADEKGDASLRVTCEELRPDIAWARIQDRAWRWHPKGRPAVDLTRVVAAVRANRGRKNPVRRPVSLSK
ncbi:MAG: transcriptional regulator [Beijerinckiaceae bacterium]